MGPRTKKILDSYLSTSKMFNLMGPRTKKDAGLIPVNITAADGPSEHLEGLGTWISIESNFVLCSTASAVAG